MLYGAIFRPFSGQMANETEQWAYCVPVLHSSTVQNMSFMIKVVKRHGEQLILCPPPFENGVGFTFLPLFQGGGANLSTMDHACGKPLRREVRARLRARGNFAF